MSPVLLIEDVHNRLDDTFQRGWIGDRGRRHTEPQQCLCGGRADRNGGNPPKYTIECGATDGLVQAQNGRRARKRHRIEGTRIDFGNTGGPIERRVHGAVRDNAIYPRTEPVETFRQRRSGDRSRRIQDAFISGKLAIGKLSHHTVGAKFAGGEVHGPTLEA